MRVITPDLLVAAVTELSKGSKLVRAKDIIGWCERNLVDCRADGLKDGALWDADRDEARGQRRLLKFKSGECKQSRLGWALIAHGAPAREAATLLGWREQLWNGETWDWVGGIPQIQARRPRASERVQVEAAQASAA